MIIDLHVHPFCKEATIVPDFQTAFERQFGSVKNEALKDMTRAMLEVIFSQRSITDLVAEMDDAGISKACIVAMDMSTHYGVELVTNEDVAGFAKQFPDRFIPFASVDPTMGQLAIDKLIHAVKDLGCKGLKLVPPVQHFDFSDRKFYPLWETVLDLDILLWTHCAHKKSHPDSDARLGHPMRVEPVAIDLPELKIVLGHCGFPWAMEAWSVVMRHPNVYMDISAYPLLYDQFPWQAYSRYDCEHKLLFATDAPLLSFQETLEALEKVDLSEDFREKILYKNAVALLGLE